jgi:hypothetical protein
VQYCLLSDARVWSPSSFCYVSVSVSINVRACLTASGCVSARGRPDATPPFYQVVVRHACVLCDVLQGHALCGTVVDAQRLMFCYTLDAIAEIGFGEALHALTQPTRIGDCFDDAQVSH